MTKLKYVRDKKLVWLDKPPDEKYWESYWNNLGSDLLLKKTHTYIKSKMGKILRKELHKEGFHIDVGCGIGLWPHVLTQLEYQIIGIEYSKHVVIQAKTYLPTLPVIVGDALNLCLEADTCDSYISLGVMEHREEGIMPFLIEAKRVLKKDGKIIVSVPYFGLLRKVKALLKCYKVEVLPEMNFFQYGYQLRELKTTINKVGFNIENVSFLGAHRLLNEEIIPYKKIYNFVNRRSNKGKFIRRLLERTVGLFDGHMVVIIGKKFY